MAVRRRGKWLHSESLDEVIIALLESPRWKKTLLGLEPPEELVIDASAVPGWNDLAAGRIRHFQLAYLLSVDPNNERGADRGRPPGRVRGDGLRNAREPDHRGRTQLNESPEKPGRFRRPMQGRAVGAPRWARVHRGKTPYEELREELRSENGVPLDSSNSHTVDEQRSTAETDPTQINPHESLNRSWG